MQAGLETLAAVETPEQIGLDVELAGVGSRFLAYLIDLLWQSLVLIAAIVAAVMLARAEEVTLTSKRPESMYLSTWGIALVSLVFFVVNFGYFTFFEMIWRGQTPGKRALSLRVLREGGYPLDFGASFLRNLLRIVDFLPFGYVVGVTAMVLGERWQRVGDLAGRTWVVRESVEGVGRLSVAGGDRKLAADVLERLGSMEPRLGEELLREMAEHIAARRGEPRPDSAAIYLNAVANESAT